MTTAEMRRSGRITDGMRIGWRALRDSIPSSSTPAPTLPEWPYQEQRGSDLTASAPVSDVSAPAAQMGYGPFFIQFLKDVGAEYEDVPLF